MTDRAAQVAAFLDRSGWGGAGRARLAGDASDRRYDRLTRGAQSAVLMDAPPGQGDDPAVFLKVAAHLSQIGLSAPRCLAEDLAQGFLVLEDFGDGVFARLITQDPGREAGLYHAATDVLLHLQARPAMPGLPDLAAADWAEAACFALDWYRFAITGDHAETGRFRDAVAGALQRLADGPRVMILRDYHAENLMWLPDRDGVARVGLLDFQLAQMGQPGYDLVSLLQDARREVAPETEAAAIRQFIAGRGLEAAAFEASYAALGAQRALRILGVFARLCLKGGKPGYLPLLPRVWDQLWRNLRHPALAGLADLCRSLLPPPDATALQRMGAQCGHFR